MNKFWNRAGWLSLAVCALLACLVLQVIMGAVVMLPAAVWAGVQAGREGITDIARMEAMILEKSMDFIPWGVLLYHVFSLPVFGLWYYFGCGRPKAANPFRILTQKAILLVIITGFGLNLLANGIAMLLQFITPGLYEKYLSMMETAGMGQNTITIVASVLLAPMGEELLCRGIIMHYLSKMSDGMGSKRMAFWTANIIQAFFFGIMHGNFIQGVYAFVLGLGLGLLCEKYQSLYPAILCHFVINALSVYIMGHLFSWIPESLLSAFILTITGLAISFVSIWIKDTPQ